MFTAISDKEFGLFRDLIHEIAGIHLSDAKKALVSGRLGKRLRHHGLATFKDYHDLVMRKDAASERQVMVDLLTTNETYFFREPKHFDFVRDQLVPRWRHLAEVRLWSAACSSGEEPYTLGMLLADARGFDGWRILATDISGRVLEEARQGVYPLAEGERIPKSYLSRFCLKGVRSQSGNFCIDARVRERIAFKQFNLNASWSGLDRYHAVFLRNVMIYFNQQTKARLVDRIADQLEPEGHLIIGHSESLNGVSTRFETVMPSVYRLKS